MGLPWVRLDTNIWSHDKTAELFAGRRHKAFALWVCGLAYAAGHATDGLISRHALATLKFSRKDADQLVEARMWDHAADGAYQIRNYSERQPVKLEVELQNLTNRMNICSRWMKEGKPCSCGQH